MYSDVSAVLICETRALFQIVTINTKKEKKPAKREVENAINRDYQREINRQDQSVIRSVIRGLNRLFSKVLGAA